MRQTFIFLLLIILAINSCLAQESKKPFRIGVAGLTHGHVNGILNRAHDGDIEIVGIAEADRALAERLLNRYKLPLSLLYSSLDEMIEKAKPEAVTAFASTYDHLAVVKACAPRGIHVMVEKPLAVSLEHAKQIQQLAAKNSIYVLTNYETTWYGSNLELNELFIESQPFGAIRKMVIHDGHEGPKEIGVGNEFLTWLTDPVKNGGGALMDFGCYGANLSTWLMKGKRPLSVMAITQQIKPAVYPLVDDEATIVVTYPEAQTIIQASWNWPFGRKDIEVYAVRGYAIADRQGSRVKSKANEPEKIIAAPALEKPYNDPFAYLAAVVRGEIKVQPTDLSSLENNMIVMEILEAAKKSAKEGKVIPLK
jgi:predicted dehydrogenase